MSLAEEIREVEQHQQHLVTKAEQIKAARRQQIGWLAEHCGILALPDDLLCQSFRDIAHQAYQQFGV